MKKKDVKNEGIGIISTIIILVIAILGIYYLYSHHSVPLEAPAPINDSAG